MDPVVNKVIYVYNKKTYHVIITNKPFLLAIDRVDCNIGDEIILKKIYDTNTGFVPVENQAVVARCVEQDWLGKKGINYKFRRRIGWSVTKGFRPKYTIFRVGGQNGN